MLETIKSLINEPTIPFDSFYLQYIMSVQDMNIQAEFEYLINHNTLTINSIDKLISNDLGELVNHGKF